MSSLRPLIRIYSWQKLDLDLKRSVSLIVSAIDIAEAALFC